MHIATKDLDIAVGWWLMMAGYGGCGWLWWTGGNYWSIGGCWAADGGRKQLLMTLLADGRTVALDTT